MAVVRTGVVGGFGKIPAKADFLRANTADPAAQHPIAWLEQGVEQLHEGPIALLPRPVRFVFTAGASTLVGVLRASRDRVGRAFPLGLFGVLPANECAANFPAIPLAAADFLSDAEALAAESLFLDDAALVGRALLLVAPPAAQLKARFDAVLAGAQHDEVAVGDWAKALWVLRTATAAVRGRPPARAQVTLDCGVSGEGDRFAWLEIVRRLLGWRAAPPFFWSERRLLVALGPPDKNVLGWLSDEARTSPRLWAAAPALADAGEGARRTLAELLSDVRA